MGMGQCICRRGFELAIGKIVPCWYYCLCRLLVFYVGSNGPHGAARLEYVLSADNGQESISLIFQYFTCWDTVLFPKLCARCSVWGLCLSTGFTSLYTVWVHLSFGILFITHFTDLEHSRFKILSWCGWFLCKGCFIINNIGY